MRNEDLVFWEARKLGELIQGKVLAPIELIQVFLDRMEKINRIVNAYCI
jgi:Asp-tRNA(Asn)/Glu-tRNA(Gln) amidotransferase A subunit family amidase